MLTHMLREARPDMPVLFLETFHHFAADADVQGRADGEVGTQPDQPARAASRRLGLWQTESTQACCARHKVGPLFAALERHDVWFTALRRDQSPSRANLQEVEPFKLPSGKMIRRVAPLASWTDRDVWRYAKEHGIPLLPLYELGYTSIGCEPCTIAARRSGQPALRALAGPEARVRDPYSGQVSVGPAEAAPHGDPRWPGPGFSRLASAAAPSSTRTTRRQPLPPRPRPTRPASPVRSGGRRRWGRRSPPATSATG